MLTARRWVIVLGLAVVPSLLVACDSNQAANSPTAFVSPSPTPFPPGHTKYRWGNITFVVPDEVFVARYMGNSEANSPGAGPTVRLALGFAEMYIDARSGKVVRELMADDAATRTELRRAFETITVGDEGEGPLPWPLGKTPPDEAKYETLTLKFWEPDPASGILLTSFCRLAPTSPGSDICAIGIMNGRSTWSIYGSSGELGHDDIAPEDATTFNRWIASVERTAPPSPAPVPAGYTKHRWGNVTVVVPDEVVWVGRTTMGRELISPDGGMVIELRRPWVQGAPDMAVRIDAGLGRVLDPTDGLDKELLDAIATIRVGEPFPDPPPWPLGTTPPTTAKEVAGRVSYWVPDPQSGIDTFFVSAGSGQQQAGSGCAVGIDNGRSRLGLETGVEFRTHDDVKRVDVEAFNGWLAETKYLDP